MAVSGQYIIMETPDTFGGEKFVRFDTLDFLHVVGVVVGVPSSSSFSSSAPYSPMSLPSLTPTSSYGSLSGSSSHGFVQSQSPVGDMNNVQQSTSHHQVVMGGAIALPIPPLGLRRGIVSNSGSGVVGQRVSISYAHPVTKESGIIVLQTAQAIQLHSMLRCVN